MQGLLQAAVENPTKALSVVLDDTLHPGGADATRRLLERANLAAGETVLDLGCGAGPSRELAHEAEARWIGLDRHPRTPDAVAGAMRALPLAPGAVDVVVSECAMCLSADLDRALAEARRVLAPGGRLAVSDVALEREIDGLPGSVERALCVDDPRPRQRLVDRVEAAGFTVREVVDHHDALVEMRRTLLDRVDVYGLLAAMGPRGEALLEGVEDLEAALEDRELGYVSLVADA